MSSAASVVNKRQPVNDYPDDDCTNRPVLLWRSHCNDLYTNWLNYYVYQTTRDDIRKI